MRPVSIELFDPPIEIGLQLFDRSIKLFPEGDAIELVQRGLVEPLHDPIGLRAFGIRAGVIDARIHGARDHRNIRFRDRSARAVA